MTRNRPATLPTATDTPTDASAPKADLPTPVATPTLPVIDWANVDVDLVAKVYADADVSTKAKIRTVADKAFRAAVVAGDLAKAQAIMAAQAVMVTTKGGTKADAPDYAHLAAQRAASLILAAHMILSGDLRPEGVPDDVTLPVSDDKILFDLSNAMISTAPENDLESVRDAATKIASARIVTGTKAAKRDVSAHLAKVAASIMSDGKGARFVSVAGLSKVHTEVYGDDLPSTGAVAAALSRDTFMVAGIAPLSKGAALPAGNGTAPSDGAWITEA